MNTHNERLSRSQTKVGSLVYEYEIEFLELDRHISMLYTSEHEMAHAFIRGLAMPLHLPFEHFIVAGFSFPQVVDHARAMERACI